MKESFYLFELLIEERLDKSQFFIKRKSEVVDVPPVERPVNEFSSELSGFLVTSNSVQNVLISELSEKSLQMMRS